MEVTNTCKALDLTDRVPEELWMEIHDIVQEAGIHLLPKKKEMQKPKMAVWEGLTNSREKREAKGKGEKERYTHLNVEFQRVARRDKKAFLNDQCKAIEENNKMGKIEICSRKLEIARKHFMQRWAQ